MNAANTLKKLGIEKTFDYIYKDPDKNMPKIMDWADKFAEGEFPTQREMIREAITDPKHPYYNFIRHLINDVDPKVTKTLAVNFFINSALVGWKKEEELRKKYNCNIPWAILLDPTSACNLHCTGCWAAEYGHKLNLTYDEIDDIICQGKKLGVYLYIYTGGEPLVRKRDLIRLCEKHSDCVFLCFTNATLIDEEFADEMLRVGNFVPAISLEGFEEATDGRRGEGVYQKVRKAMELLRSKKLIYGISCCYTSANYDSITSEEFYDSMIEMGAYFVWYFHYMPVGNDAEYVGGCVAGGHRYLHINANGDIDPCVFIHYSDSNIREKSLLDTLRSPMMMAYHDNQPFNDNMLRPCPMLENPEKLREMVAKSGAHSTDLQSPETVEHLCAKCDQYAKDWQPAADKLWNGGKAK